MKLLMMAGVSALALGIAPATAQQTAGGGDRTASDFPCPHYDMERSGLRSDDVKEAMRRDASGASNRNAGGAGMDEGPARDAVGDDASGWAARTGAERDDRSGNFEELAEKLPVPDVADSDVETRSAYQDDEDGPIDPETPSGDGSGRSASSTGGESAMAQGSSEASDDELSGIIEEGEVVPDGIRDWQDKERWDRGAQGDQLSADRLRGMDGRDGSNSGSDGTSTSATRDDRGTMRDSRQTAETDDDAAEATIEERRRILARVAALVAQQAVPDARFSAYRFTIDDNERVIEISGRDRTTGDRVSVDVYADGRVQSIDTAISLDAVPESVRSAVRSELGRFRVAHTTRSLRRDLDVYYEFAGFSENGRPLAVEIRSDGRDMSVRYLERG